MQPCFLKNRPPASPIDLLDVPLTVEVSGMIVLGVVFLTADLCRGSVARFSYLEVSPFSLRLV